MASKHNDQQCSWGRDRNDGEVDWEEDCLINYRVTGAYYPLSANGPEELPEMELLSVTTVRPKWDGGRSPGPNEMVDILDELMEHELEYACEAANSHYESVMDAMDECEEYDPDVERERREHYEHDS